MRLSSFDNRQRGAVRYQVRCSAVANRTCGAAIAGHHNVYGSLMKLSVITDEISQDFDHALDVMAEYGVTGAELRGLWSVNIADLSREDVARAKQSLRDHRMSVTCLATPIFKCDLDVDAATVEGP